MVWSVRPAPASPILAVLSYFHFICHMRRLPSFSTTYGKEARRFGEEHSGCAVVTRPECWSVRRDFFYFFKKSEAGGIYLGAFSRVGGGGV
jgi:hypothetical protein